MDEVLDLTDKRLIKALKTENDALKEENQEVLQEQPQELQNFLFLFLS